jgi:hypothetical protein
MEHVDTCHACGDAIAPRSRCMVDLTTRQITCEACMRNELGQCAECGVRCFEPSQLAGIPAARRVRCLECAVSALGLPHRQAKPHVTIH